MQNTATRSGAPLLGVTDEDGRLEYEFTYGTFILRTEKAGYDSKETSVSVDADDEMMKVEIILERTSSGGGGTKPTPTPSPTPTPTSSLTPTPSPTGGPDVGPTPPTEPTARPGQGDGELPRTGGDGSHGFYLGLLALNTLVISVLLIRFLRDDGRNQRVWRGKKL